MKEYARKFNLPILIETGTYHGEMVLAMKNVFRDIFSIELQAELYSNAVNKFSKYKHIRIIQGDSTVELNKILQEIREPCLFWLDGHYSAGETAKGEKETPIMEELEQIFSSYHKGHVILIDDAREFVGENDYPTLSALEAFVSERRPDSTFEVEDDIIRIYAPIAHE
ncbi:MAG: hypothetical protein L3J03_07615 [Desulfobacterales bacterium]|nr:hypothetical protein [Desulfobacterales bacterium]